MQVKPQKNRIKLVDIQKKFFTAVVMDKIKGVGSRGDGEEASQLT